MTFKDLTTFVYLLISFLLKNNDSIKHIREKEARYFFKLLRHFLLNKRMGVTLTGQRGLGVRGKGEPDGRQ